MAKLIHQFHNPLIWGALVFFACGLSIIGWADTYPVIYSPADVPILQSVSPLFWAGMFLGFVGLAGLSLSSDSKIVQWLCCVAFVLLLTSPHFLFLAWGSDAGALATMSDYTTSMVDFNFSRDVRVNSYFQWPLSIFYNQFLADLFNTNVYAAARIILLLTCVGVSSGLFLLWYDPFSGNTAASKAVFWGLTAYFAGFYWIFNWQTAPYGFSLILLIPALALLERPFIQDRLLLFLLIIVGFEAHALFGVWFGLIICVYLIFLFLNKKERSKAPTGLLMFIVVAQITIILYKNIRFLDYLVNSFKGIYDALLLTDASDRALVDQTQRALSAGTENLIGAVLKTVGFVDLGIIWFALLLACLIVLYRKRLRIREASLFVAGVIYFLIGTQYAAIGTRSIQLIALVPAFFVVDSIHQKGKIGRFILGLCVVGLLLFPSAIMRSFQNSGNFVKPGDLALNRFIGQFQSEISDSGEVIFSEHIRPVDLRMKRQLVSPNTILTSQGCENQYLFVDTRYLREFVRLKLGEEKAQALDSFIESNIPTVVYDNGALKMRIGEDCGQIYRFFVDGRD